MSYIFKTNIANKSNHGGKRNTGNIKYLVYHYTGNDGDTDEGNGNHFHNHIVKASAHYFVDDDSVTQSVPDNYIAYSVGGSVSLITTHYIRYVLIQIQSVLKCVTAIKMGLLKSLTRHLKTQSN